MNGTPSFRARFIHSLAAIVRALVPSQSLRTHPLSLVKVSSFSSCSGFVDLHLSHRRPQITIPNSQIRSPQPSISHIQDPRLAGPEGLNPEHLHYRFWASLIVFISCLVGSDSKLETLSTKLRF